MTDSKDALIYDLIEKWNVKKKDNALNELLLDIVEDGKADIVRFFTKNVDLERFGEDQLVIALQKAVENRDLNTISPLLSVINDSEVIGLMLSGIIEDVENKSDRRIINFFLFRPDMKTEFIQSDILKTAIEKRRMDIIKDIVKMHKFDYGYEFIELAKELGYEDIAEFLEENITLSVF